MKKNLICNCVIYFSLSLAILNACTRVCYMQEVDEFGNEVDSEYGANMNSKSYSACSARRTGGYERFKRFLYGAGNGSRAIQEDPEHIFKIRFCNYMLGYRDDNPKELVEMAKDISTSYKRMRMYDMASKYDSYQDVLIYGKETIPESWDDTTDLLEEFRRNLAIKKHKEICRQKKAERDNMSFWEKIFGKSKKKARCDYVNGEVTFDPESTSDIVPTVIMPPPGYYNYRDDPQLRESCSACSVGR